MYDRPQLAADIADGAVAEAGRIRALWWALGLLTAVESVRDARDVALLVWAVLRAPVTALSSADESR